MSDGRIELHHQQIDEAAAMLRQQSQMMHEMMQQTQTFLTQGLGHELHGDYADGGQAYADVLAKADTAMTDDVAKAAAALDEVHGLIRDSDRRAGSNFGR
ncbi:hypothetical protein AB0O91_11700 [Kitasatospora sp. NPDC089797]|uniref:hypothetical protein n=1 Tax=Kitasatospora sp. NPDC089797 TaxID=3155298 RepID=UPI00341F207B